MVLPSDDVALTLSQNIIQLQEVANFAIVNLTLEGSQTVPVTGNQLNAVSIINCTIKNVGGGGLQI